LLLLPVEMIDARLKSNVEFPCTDEASFSATKTHIFFKYHQFYSHNKYFTKKPEIEKNKNN